MKVSTTVKTSMSISEKINMMHYPKEIFYDNLGEGYRIECNCGYVTGPSKQVEDCGYDFDEHTKEQQ